MSEQWKQINQYYRISSEGVIESIRRGKARILKTKRSNSGYVYVDLGRSNRQYVHRLIAIAFIDNPENKLTVNHKNGIKTDNRIDNLEWSTYSENHRHAYKIGIHPKRLGEKASKAILDATQVKTIRACYPKIRQFELAKYFMMDSASINSIIAGRNWKHLL